MLDVDLDGDLNADRGARDVPSVAQDAIESKPAPGMINVIISKAITFFTRGDICFQILR